MQAVYTTSEWLYTLQYGQSGNTPQAEEICKAECTENNYKQCRSIASMWNDIAKYLFLGFWASPKFSRKERVQNTHDESKYL